MSLMPMPNHQQTTPRAAAFFDLDKTILDTSSSVALRSPLIDSGLMTRRGAALGLLLHLPYLLRGADHAAMERMGKQLGAMSRGWDSAVLEATVRDALSTCIDPVCFTEALDQIAIHRAAGQPVVIASASVSEMVRPIGDLLGADFVIGSEAARDEDGTFTGELTSLNYADEKARACAALAAEQGWDLSQCFAYSDSVTDLPLLESVGHPVAVNPDRGLREAAEERGWQILTFQHTARVRSSASKAALPIAAATIGVGLAATATYCLLRARQRARLAS